MKSHIWLQIRYQNEKSYPVTDPVSEWKVISGFIRIRMKSHFRLRFRLRMKSHIRLQIRYHGMKSHTRLWIHICMKSHKRFYPHQNEKSYPIMYPVSKWKVISSYVSSIWMKSHPRLLIHIKKTRSSSLLIEHLACVVRYDIIYALKGQSHEINICVMGRGVPLGNRHLSSSCYCSCLPRCLTSF